MAIDVQVWLFLLVLFLAAEAVSLGLTTIWFAGGALVALALAAFGVGVPVQVIVFFVISVTLLIFTRPVATRWLNRSRAKTNAGSLIGETAVVTEAIDNLENKGQAQVRGQIWTARSSEEGTKISSGKLVTIKEISGVKLIVKEKIQ